MVFYLCVFTSWCIWRSYIALSFMTYIHPLSLSLTYWSFILWYRSCFILFLFCSHLLQSGRTSLGRADYCLSLAHSVTWDLSWDSTRDFGLMNNPCFNRFGASALKGCLMSWTSFPHSKHYASSARWVQPLKASVATSTTAAAALLFVKSFAYRNYTDRANKRIIRCNRMDIKDAGSTTPDFIRYLKVTSAPMDG